MAKMITVLVFTSLLAGCFEAQRAAGCNNTGIFGCKDAPAEIQPPDPELRPAPAGGRSPQHPWTQPLNDCMAAGGLRTECFEQLPPDILVQYEAWEAERAAIRRRQFEQRRELNNSPVFGMKPQVRGE